MSHSKRNTSLAFFTSYERSLLRNSWGSQSTRLTRDSFLPFASCRLCLLPARDPVACSSGSKADVFCRECALNDLVAQRKEIKRLEREWEDREIDKGEAERLDKEEEARRELETFERTAQGLEVSSVAANGNKKKRKVDELESAEIPDSRKLKSGEEKTEASFWVPGVDVKSSNPHMQANEKPSKLHPICPASTPSTKHPYSLRTLITVHFTEEKDDKTESIVRTCPACKKGLSNSSKATLAKPCGHVLCGSCVEKFMKLPDIPHAHNPDPKEKDAYLLCYVCETDVTERRQKPGKEHGGKDKMRPGLVEISCEGTGFAGGGTNMAKRQGVAFQC
ncbi:hypothetical protein GJ744_005355 [Endocarpon pusillum]|uniref:RING-type domain-containing protein n=1 Tax=Endocarpon pusillum TaxID=364733 RepID=A0A8H7AN02_9EURO|nr:hypothetical protein GJ744_005355 [Endocarpon pusillum]